MCVCAFPPAAQNELSVVVVNGKGHLSSKGVLARNKERQRQGTDKPQKRKRQGCWVHCNQLCVSVCGFFYSSVEKS